MSTRRFEFREGKSDKFWTITVEGKATTVTYGRRGTKGQSQTKKWASDADARKQYETLIAEKRKKGYVETNAAGRAKPAVPAPWSPAVTSQLERLEIACKPFDPPDAPRPLDRFGEFGRPGGKSWRGVDPEGQVKRVPPAIWAFVESLDLSPRMFLRTDAGPFDYARMPLYIGRYDVVVDGVRRVLVMFACGTAGDFLFDLRDRSPDPAVWIASQKDPRSYPPDFSIAYPTLSSFLATLAADGARPDQMPPWAPAVTAELQRLRAVVVPFDPNAPRPVSVGSSFWVPHGDPWESVDPQGQVTEVPPAVYGFLENVDFRTSDLQLVDSGGGEPRVLAFGGGNENPDLVVDGKRRLLVTFASSDTGFFYSLDLCDRSTDPAVWSVDHASYEDAYIKFKRLSQFLAALRS
jgi:predicted DNA-binding WGR domain protein